MKIDTFCFIWLTLNIYIIHGELDWVVNERVSGYGDNVTLFCLVDDCCKKVSGWIKFDPDYKTIFLDVRDFKHKTSKIDKYAATTNRTGFGLVIKNVRQDDFNIKYLCSYGFKKSSQKVLSKSDVFKVDEPQSKLLLAVIVIGPITAVVIILVAVVRWRRKKNSTQNENSSERESNIMNTEEKTTTKPVTSRTETVDELSKEDPISQSKPLLQNAGEAVIQTAENSSKDNQSTPQPEQSQKSVKELISKLQNEPENITYMHGDKENESKE